LSTGSRSSFFQKWFHKSTLPINRNKSTTDGEITSAAMWEWDPDALEELMMTARTSYSVTVENE